MAIPSARKDRWRTQTSRFRTATPRPTPEPTPKPTPAPSPAPTPAPIPTPTPPATTDLPWGPPARSVERVDGVDVDLLVRRATFGATDATLAEVRRLGPVAWLDAQLQPATIDDSRFEAVLARFPPQTETPQQVRQRFAANPFTWDAMFTVKTVAVARALWSQRQLLEVMVDLWSNHFNVACPSDDVWDSRTHYDHTVRTHALGRFADLLPAVVMHPAMLRYLTNDTSTKQIPNENLGRELLELHTVGLAAGYSEDDVLHSSRILTGLSVDGTTGMFRYRKDWHHVGPVRVLDFSHANGDAAAGVTVATAYLDHLAHHPATARHVVTKLVTRFVSDTPDPALVTSLVRTYLDHDTAVAPVLRALFASPQMAASTGCKLRRPAEDVYAAARAVGTQPPTTGTSSIRDLMWQLDSLGNSPFGWQPPNGYPDVAAAWLSPGLSFRRWHTKIDVVAGWWPNGLTGRDLKALVPSPRPATHGELVDALARRVLFRDPPDNLRTAVLEFLGVTATTPVTSGSAAVGWRLPFVVALLLDSPTHLSR